MAYEANSKKRRMSSHDDHRQRIVPRQEGVAKQSRMIKLEPPHSRLAAHIPPDPVLENSIRDPTPQKQCDSRPTGPRIPTALEMLLSQREFIPLSKDADSTPLHDQPAASVEILARNFFFVSTATTEEQELFLPLANPQPKHTIQSICPVTIDDSGSRSIAVVADAPGASRSDHANILSPAYDVSGFVTEQTSLSTADLNPSADDMNRVKPLGRRKLESPSDSFKYNTISANMDEDMGIKPARWRDITGDLVKDLGLDSAKSPESL
jgi:hypothetical protein